MLRKVVLWSLTLVACLLVWAVWRTGFGLTVWLVGMPISWLVWLRWSERYWPSFVQVIAALLWPVMLYCTALDLAGA